MSRREGTRIRTASKQHAKARYPEFSRMGTESERTSPPLIRGRSEIRLSYFPGKGSYPSLQPKRRKDR
jgi:hypothetical protein